LFNSACAATSRLVQAGAGIQLLSNTNPLDSLCHTPKPLNRHPLPHQNFFDLSKFPENSKIFRNCEECFDYREDRVFCVNLWREGLQK
jgi:hypothetical protein